MRRATRRIVIDDVKQAISIHALHEESDSSAMVYVLWRIISIHALHEESDLGESDKQANGEFQSTLSMRRATRSAFAPVAPVSFQSTLSMRRATFFGKIVRGGFVISIHALHEESDRLP